MRDHDETVKIGSGHLAAMGRQGLAELRAAFYPESNVAQPAQLGTFGVWTPGEVAEARRADGRHLNEEPHASLADRVQEAEKSKEKCDREPPEMERE